MPGARLTDDQRAAVALSVQERRSALAKKQRASGAGKQGGVGRPKANSLGDAVAPKLKAESKPRSRPAVAKEAKVSERKLKKAASTKKNDPALLQQVRDGRNRYQACAELGIVPDYREWDGQGSLVAFVVSLNLHRRHLDESQRAMVGARIKPLFEDEAHKRQGTRTDLQANWPEGEAGQARDKAAEAVNVGPRSVERASKVLA